MFLLNKFKVIHFYKGKPKMDGFGSATLVVGGGAWVGMGLGGGGVVLVKGGQEQ